MATEEGVGDTSDECQGCGKPIAEAHAFCPHCGTQHSMAADTEKPFPMISESWYHGVWISMLSLLLFTPLIFFVPETGLASFVSVLGFVGASVVLPLSIHLDNKFVHAFSDRTPSVTPYFIGSLVPFINIVVGAFYLSMRVNIPEISQETNPVLESTRIAVDSKSDETSSRHRASEKWYIGVALGVVVWTGFFVLASLVPSGSANGLFGTLVDVYSALTIVTFFAFPVVIYLDCRHIESTFAWDRHTKTYLVGSVIPLLNIIVGVIYLVRRREVLGIP